MPFHTKAYRWLLAVSLSFGCADFNYTVWPSILGSEKDGPGLPRYLDKRESELAVGDTESIMRLAVRDALTILGFSQAALDSSVVTATRPFTMGFVCGIGGETLYLEIVRIDGRIEIVKVVSYKTFPYPSSTRFFDDKFIDLLRQLLERTDA